MTDAEERAEAQSQPGSGTVRIPRGRLSAYALLELAIGGPLNVMTLFLGFQYAELGVSLEAVGWIVMGARLLDFSIDPAVGLLSDRTRNRFGRRKTWIVAGTPIFALSLWRLFLPPAEVDAAYFALWMVLFWLGFSMLNIPYYAWGAELWTVDRRGLLGANSSAQPRTGTGW